MELNRLCCETGNISGEGCQHTSPNCSLYKGLTENDGTVRNFIFQQEDMTGIRWAPTLLSLMNLDKIEGACDQLIPSLFVSSGATPPGYYCKGKLVTALPTTVWWVHSLEVKLCIDKSTARPHLHKSILLSVAYSSHSVQEKGGNIFPTRMTLVSTT